MALRLHFTDLLYASKAVYQKRDVLFINSGLL